MLLCAACQSEERLVRYKPFLTGVDGAQFGTQPVGAGSEARPLEEPLGSETTDSGLIIEKPDGSRELVLSSPKHVMIHLERLLDDGETELILDQLVSVKTREEFEQRAEEPEAIVKYFEKHRREIARLFARMPMAQNSPSVALDQPGDRVWVIRLSGAARRDMKLTELWVRLEGGKWHLMWIK